MSFYFLVFFVTQKIALIAGEGHLPQEIQKRTSVLTFGFYGLSYDQLHLDYQIHLGAVGELMRLLKHHAIKKICFAGALKRPPLKTMALDKHGAQWIKKIGLNYFRGDDTLLSCIIQLVEKEGFTVVASQDILQEIIPAKKGALVHEDSSTHHENDIRIGFEILEKLSPYDIGQSLIIHEQRILGLEGPEGTQALIQRCADLRLTKLGGILVKAKKTHQSLKVDLPTIGLETIQLLKKHHFSGLALSSVQILDQESCLTLAAQAPLFVYNA